MNRALVLTMLAICCLPAASAILAQGAPKPKSEAPASQPASAPASQAIDRAKIKGLIADLSSDDGAKRVAATKQLLALGANAVDPLAEAGAQQLTPKCQLAEVRRLDAVYTLLDGLHQNASEGYRTDLFLVRVEKDCTVEEVSKIAARCGFTIKARNGINDGYCGAFPQDQKNLAGILKAILSGEPKVISVQLTYFVAHPTP